MKLSIRADLELCYQEHVYRLVSGAEGLELQVPSLSAATAVFRVPDFQVLARQAEEFLQAVSQTIRVTYRGKTLATLGSGSWTLSALVQALEWLQ